MEQATVQKPWYLRTWFIVTAVILVVVFLVTSSIAASIWRGYQHLQRADIARQEAGGEVNNQYMRRNSLIPNLFEAVKGEANFEKSTLTAVIDARARATSITLTPQTLNDPKAMAQFSKYQGDLTTAMSRLMVASENYPTLQANQAFREFRTEWTGTENRCGTARNRLIKAIAAQNAIIRAEFPETLIAKFINMNEVPQFGEGKEAELEVAPKINFSDK